MNKKIVLILILVVVAVPLLIYFAFPDLIVNYGIKKIRSESGLVEKSVNVGDHRIAYLEGGQGETILMVHGFGGNKDNWTSFAKYITPKYHVLALDLPGFGASTFLETAAYGYVDQARRLDLFMAAMGVDKFHIVGNSMGGHISGRYAVMFPAKVASLGLFDAAGVTSPEPSELGRILAEGGKNPLIVEKPEDFDALMAFAFVRPPEIPKFVKKVLIQEGLKHRAGNQKIFGEITSQLTALEPDLGLIQAPTLVLWGSKDRILDVSGADVFAGNIKNATKVIMENCGHLPMIERPEEAAGNYLVFLDKAKAE
jgi:pimeloyl-ACP methyl ester carboxylesterase